MPKLSAPHFQSVDSAEAAHSVSTDCKTTYDEKHPDAKTVGDAQVTVQLAKAEQNWPSDGSAISLSELCLLVESTSVLPRGIKAGVIALINSVETATTPTGD